VRALALALICAAGFGCRPEAQLLDHSGFEAVGAAEDLWAEHRPADVDCPELAWGEESAGGVPVVEVDTNECHYLTARASLPENVLRGEPLRLRVWHFDLFYSEQAEGHMALAIDGDVLFDYAIDIPGDAAMIDETVDAPRTYPAGAELQWHLHNHGANTWNLVDLLRNPE
jgi:hypothetical protein